MKKAIIIGASSGIGKELAITLAKNGYEVGLMARRVDLLEELKNQISTKSYVGHIDISQVPKAIEKVNQMIQAMQGVDLVVINAGVGFLNPELDWSKEQQTLDVNVYGFCAIAGEIYKHFAKQGKGHIAGISSIAALGGNPVAPAYNASKAFMSNYLEGLRKKAFQEKLPLVITDIKPGFVDTEMAKGDGKFWVAPPQKAAEQIYSAIKKQKNHAYITRRWRFIGWILKSMPDWLYQRVG
jgi:short-subunit dehydrogenase